MIYYFFMTYRLSMNLLDVISRWFLTVACAFSGLHYLQLHLNDSLSARSFNGISLIMKDVMEMPGELIYGA